MKKVLCILVAFVMLMFTGCTSTNSNTKTNTYNYAFKGENESWTAEYKVSETETYTDNGNKSTYENSGNNVLTVTYKNDISELSSVKHMEISFSSIPSSGSMIIDFNDSSPSEKTYTIKSGFENGTLTVKDQVIKVAIVIDGNTQTIDLTKKD